MPARAPAITNPDQEQLVALGARLREVRRRQKVSAVAAAEAAGLSRVTLHRIERGKPSVAMGAWLAAARTLGLSFDLANPAEKPDTVVLPERIRIDDYPELKKLAWQLGGVDEIRPAEALELYERNWRHVDRSRLSMKEVALVDALLRTLGGGRLLV